MLFGWPTNPSQRSSAICVTEVVATRLTPDLLKVEKLPPSLRRVVAVDGQRALEEISQNLVGATSEKTDQRLASWLARSFDNAGRNELSATHSHLAQLLGVRRASVTVALHVLEGERAIRNLRGRVILLNRQRLNQLTVCTAD
jgi:hypothetical protein